MSNFGNIIRMLDAVPRALIDEPNASAPDFALVARRMEEIAAKIRIIGDCRAADTVQAPPPRLRAIQSGARGWRS